MSKHLRIKSQFIGVKIANNTKKFCSPLKYQIGHRIICPKQKEENST